MDIRPNVLFVMCDQLRADAIAALGNKQVYSPNIDRLVSRGVTFTNAYSACPVCVPARYTVRTGCEPPATGIFSNWVDSALYSDESAGIEARCGKYLARTMTERGYRTFVIGKSHTAPTYEDIGFEVHLHSEELYATPEDRQKDAFAAFIANEHPEYDWIEQPMGERTDMYYMPQMSPLPAHLTVESWAADRAIEQLEVVDNRPYFGFVSFVGPHPPLAPPLPFNRMYDPDRMPNPVCGDIEIDHMDEQIPWMNYLIWAEDINNSHARVAKARYYGEISYIDQCLGRILDAVESRPDADNTVICFFSDHGDHMGDHHAWQKESFFEPSCHVPFLVSWPNQIPSNTRCDELVSLADLFGIATSASGQVETRDGIDVLSMLNGKATPRQYMFGYYGEPGTPEFKIMVRDQEWKYIFMANGGREQLFNVTLDPNELEQRMDSNPDVADRMRNAAIEALLKSNTNAALENGKLREFPFVARPLFRIHQFDQSRGVAGFPENPGDIFSNLK